MYRFFILILNKRRDHHGGKPGRHLNRMAVFHWSEMPLTPSSDVIGVDLPEEHLETHS